MKRLFTFGCSYTYYAHPTWADLLSVEYDFYENWGLAGLGNRAIAERIAECNAIHNFHKDDTIVVQWSSHLRYDWHNESIKLGAHKGWQTNGNAFSGLNKINYDTRWYDKFFCEKSWFMHNLNFISLVQNFLDNIRCTWRMTSLGDLRNLGTDLEKQTLDYEKVFFNNQKTDKFPAWDRFSDLEFYEEKIWKQYAKNWVPPINPYVVDKLDLYWYYQAEHDKDPWYDGHPTPMQHQYWLNAELRPSLNLKSPPEEQQKIIDRCIEIKSLPFGMNALKLEHYFMKDNRPAAENLFPELHHWPNPRRGL